MIVNFLLVTIGLIICFGGFRFRKPVLGLMGISWGSIIGFICLILLQLSSDSEIDDVTKILIVIIIAAISCYLSVRLEKLLFSINTTISSFVEVLFIILLVSNDFEQVTMYMILSFVVGLIAGVLSYIYFENAFQLNTAISGAFLASIGLTGLIKHIDPLEMIQRIIYGTDNNALFGILIASTVCLSVVGFLYQKSTKNRNEKGVENHYSISTIMISVLNSRHSIYLLLIPALIAYMILPFIPNQYESNLYQYAELMTLLFSAVAIGLFICIVVYTNIKQQIVFTYTVNSEYHDSLLVS